ncbi:MAG: hypothetical protein CVV23_08830 [Ignavibacteriae bacterium HGW-Ignavibacteriae-2]|nr:hypothetical protein [Bacteroidota bacterium]PKL88723.1 MAG: hypothetical protein CVV23_08830 [Ignavibacteriae bacterium HGW-Ignavibacteriae-2]
MIERQNELKIETGIKVIEELCTELRYLNYEELKNKLWKLERETTLLKEFVSKLLSEEEYREVV